MRKKWDKSDMKDTTRCQRKFTMMHMLAGFLMLAFMILAIWSLLSYQGNFFSIILVMVSTISSSIMALIFFPKIFQNCFVLPFTLFVIFSILTLMQGLQIADRNMFIKGYIFAELIFAINMIVSIAIGACVKKHCLYAR